MLSVAVCPILRGAGNMLSVTVCLIPRDAGNRPLSFRCLLSFAQMTFAPWNRGPALLSWKARAKGEALWLWI
ncbi:hypothetical protein HMPREF9336_04125 [Segniliparus rugosus ATCC BAA-974]|uniref:Uncharacterized protein n=1 Tax=Segniliparus rugosus (strain ATCC BAA-974 / DSM 45345 / CCUG 50838 / CIP 108380 / JCM 13579 / CDC 945) TaxID=679197 RepID=U1N5M6_SEGRC|nr:hypothetical protein HMPREF9336_04125 [Segniliparus rugosus ATCC BAA-974]